MLAAPNWGFGKRRGQLLAEAQSSKESQGAAGRGPGWLCREKNAEQENLTLESPERSVSTNLTGANLAGLPVLYRQGENAGLN